MGIIKHYDIVVVGGGIAGLYCCLNAPPGARVALFEASNRIGGKIETVPMLGFQAEYGSMRFDPARQARMGRLIAELKLETEPFPEYSSPPVTEGRMKYHLSKDERNLSALELFAYGIGKILHKTVPELMLTSEEELELIRKKGSHGNQPLWQQGLWNALTDVLSYDAVMYIMLEGSFFHGIHENPGVVGTMITWVKMLQMSEHLKGIKGGMQQITDRMLKKVRGKGVEVYMGHQLRSLASSGKRVSLSFNTGTFIADRVILALPPSALRMVKGLPDDVRVLFDSVIEYPLLKCFFIVKDPWWDEDITNRGVQDVPARELHFRRRGNYGNIMIYADRPFRNFWCHYVQSREHDKAEIDGNRELSRLFAGRMMTVPERIQSFGIRDWVRKPYGAGVHLWKAGVKPWEISSRLEAFSLSAGCPSNVHICGEAFSDYQGFMEGALRSASNALNKALN